MQAQGTRDGLRHQRLIPQLVELDQPYPVAERSPQLGRRPQRQPGLADPAHPGQRDQTRTRQQPPDLGHLTVTADEAGQLPRQIPYDASLRCHDKTDATPPARHAE